MNEQGTVYATCINGKISIITGTRCSEIYCKQGCDFPSCAIFGEEFDTEDQARSEYPELELI